MEIVILQVFVSLFLVLGSVVLFAFSCRQRDFDHADRLALLPVEDGTAVAKADPAIGAERGEEATEEKKST